MSVAEEVEQFQAQALASSLEIVSMVDQWIPSEYTTTAERPASIRLFKLKSKHTNTSSLYAKIVRKKLNGKVDIRCTKFEDEADKEMASTSKKKRRRN
jgi:hypothetical protein